jgi:imidazolonepropionase-like amidohydrolase
MKYRFRAILGVPRVFLATVLMVSVAGTAAAEGLIEVNPPAAPSDPGIIALTGGRLINGRDVNPVENAVVLVQDGRILAAGSADDVPIPPDAVVKDAGGMSILPGLIDSHLHTINDLNVPALFLSHGVTTFRDPGHPFRFYQALMQTDETMPRAFLTGAHLDAYPPIWPQQAVIVRDERHARATVAEHVARGATAIKIYFRLPLDHFRPVCEAAAEHRVPVTAHLELVDADEAIRAGLSGIEHVTSFGTALADMQHATDFKETISAQPGARGELRYRLWAHLDLESEKARNLIQLIVENDIFVSPTLAVFERRADDPGATPTEAEGFANMLKFVGRCHAAGAKLVVGSHTHVPHAQRGWAYQRELELLVEAGLSPIEAIRAGTLHNAEFFRADDRLGSIETGKLADLVLVQGDPAGDVRAMYQVAHVMLHGSWVGQPPGDAPVRAADDPP